jgi:hypothetical protein
MHSFVNRRLAVLLSSFSLTLITGVGARAQTLLDLSTAPRIGGSDVYDANFAGGASGSTDYTDNPTPGQTFTAGGNKLYSITVKGAGNGGYGGNGNFYDANWHIRLSSVSGTTLTPVAGAGDISVSAAQLANTSGYVSFIFAAPISLTQGSKYAFDLYSEDGYFALAHDATASTGSFNTSTPRAFTGTTETTINSNSRTFFANFSSPAGITQSQTAPTVGANDISQLNNAGATDNTKDFTDNNPNPGQTFTTGSGSNLGYALNSLTVQGIGNGGNNFNTGNWHLQIGSVSGSGATLTTTSLAQYAFDAAPITSTTGYVTFNLGSTPLTLAPNTQYEWNLYSDNGYFGLAEGNAAAAAAFTGGSYINEGASRTFAPETASVTSGRVRTFELSLSALAPEPSALALMGSSAGLFLVGLRRRRARS